jgi:hypothetical protein
LDALRKEELPGDGVVVELTPVVALDGLHVCAELGGGVGNEGSEGAECLRLEA